MFCTTNFHDFYLALYDGILHHKIARQYISFLLFFASEKRSISVRWNIAIHMFYIFFTNYPFSYVRKKTCMLIFYSTQSWFQRSLPVGWWTIGWNFLKRRQKTCMLIFYSTQSWFQRSLPLGWWTIGWNFLKRSILNQLLKDSFEN